MGPAPTEHAIRARFRRGVTVSFRLSGARSVVVAVPIGSVHGTLVELADRDAALTSRPGLVRGDWGVCARANALWWLLKQSAVTFD